MRINKKIILTFFGLAIVSACSLSSSIDAAMEREVEAVVALKEKAKAPTKYSSDDTIRVKDDIWLGDVSTIEYEGEPLPSYLTEADAVTLVSSRPVTLYEIGDMLNKVTSMSVRFSSDIEETVKADASSNRPSVEALGADWTEPNKMILSYKGPLEGLLDEVCSRFGLWWKYEDRTIHFYQQVTKTFVIYSLPSKASLTANIGGSASGEGGSSVISLANSAEIELWANIEESIKSMVGEDAIVTADPSNGTVTVTAKPTDISKIAEYVNEQNTRLSRQVAVSVKILQVTVNDSDKYGLDLTAAFKGGSIEKLGVSTESGILQETTSPIANNISLGILSGNWDIDATVDAFSEQGTTTVVTSGTVTSLNNKPAPLQVVEKQNYISEYTVTNSGGTSGSYDVSTETEEIETGFTLDILPRILEHNRLLLMFNLTLSKLIELENIELPNGAYIQNPKIETRGFSQEVALKSNESLVLSGFEAIQNTVGKTGVGSVENSLLGGSVDVAKDRNIFVIILTPVVLDSPLMPESRIRSN